MIDPKISQVDTGLLVGYFIIVLIIGYIFARRTSTGSDYFLAGNRLRWTAIGFSLFASNISSSSIIGLTGQAYASGISIANYEWMATLILAFMAVFIIPIYLKNKIRTVPQYLELRFSPFIRKYYSFVTIVLTIIVDIASSLFAGALVLNVFFPEIPIVTACYVLALISGVYTAAGGLAAVVYTDMLQAIILIIGSCIMLFAVLGQFDFNWFEAIGQIEENQKSFIRPLSDENLPWLGTTLGVPILGFYYWTTNHYVVQRVLGAQNIPQAQWGALFAGFLKLTVLFIIVFPGIFSAQLFPDLEHPDMVYPTMLVNLIPDGVKGIVLAGLIAAIMSSVDSALNGTSALIVIDFIQPVRKDLTEDQLVKYGRVTTILIMAFAGLWAPLIENFQGLFNYLQQVLSFVVPPVVCIFLLGIFWKKGTALAAKNTLIFGHLLSVICLFLVNIGIIKIHFTIIASLLTLLCMLGFVIISHFSPGKLPGELQILTWNGQYTYQPKNYPWYSQAIFIGIVLTVLTLIIVAIYW
ncbi:MAG: sodium/solute symporter [Saprospiraceae bacterium]|nr:sodium/solute symporter [Saprospiraceae bacterium]